MGAYNNLVVLPYQPTFAEKITPTVLGVLGNAYIQKLGQDWKANQMKLANVREDKMKAAEMLSTGGWQVASPWDKADDSTIELAGKRFKPAPISLTPVMGPGGKKPLQGQYHVKGGGLSPQLITVTPKWDGPFTSVGEGDISGFPKGTVYQKNPSTGETDVLWKPEGAPTLSQAQAEEFQKWPAEEKTAAVKRSLFGKKTSSQLKTEEKYDPVTGYTYKRSFTFDPETEQKNNYSQWQISDEKTGRTEVDVAQKKEFEELRNQQEVTENVLNLADELESMATKDPTILGLVGAGQRSINRTAEQVAAAATVMAKFKPEIDGRPTTESEMMNPKHYSFNAFDESSASSAAFQSTVTRLGYMIARSQDPTGRLSDMDVQNGINQVGGNQGSLTQLRSVLRQLRKNVVSAYRIKHRIVKQEDAPEDMFNKYSSGTGSQIKTAEDFLNKVLKK